MVYNTENEDFPFESMGICEYGHSNNQAHCGPGRCCMNPFAIHTDDFRRILTPSVKRLLPPSINTGADCGLFAANQNEDISALMLRE